MKQANLLVLIQFILFGLLALAFIVYPLQSSSPVRVLGLILMISGLLVAYSAFRAHTRTNPGLPSVSPEPNQQAQLVDAGIYSRIRHPLYTAVMLCGMGVALVHGHVLLIVIALTLIPFFTYKSIFEEGLLKQVYPQYADYKKRTGRFLPF